MIEPVSPSGHSRILGNDGTGERKGFTRRSLLMAGAVVAAGVAGGAAFRHSRRLNGGNSLYPSIEASQQKLPIVNGMPMRQFGTTGLLVSEVGFGAWAIGGASYGAVPRQDALNALARAEELGCNFVDTAWIYGASEEILGEFLPQRRSRWVLATKYKPRPAGLTATVEEQLVRLRTDVIDYYQFHWYPRGPDEVLFEEMDRLKQSGKVRFVGISLSTREEVADALARPDVDGIQLPFSLLEPDPFLARVRAIRGHRKAIIIRSALREGFLAGKYKRDATFPDSSDLRSRMTPEQVAHTVDNVERFRFLEGEAGTMVEAAAGYPLSFPEVSTVILGTKNASQAASNFGEVPGTRLSPATLARISDLQFEVGVGSRIYRTLRRFGFG